MDDTTAEPSTEHPLNGNWDYSVDTPDGIYTGILKFEQDAEGMLMGNISASETPELSSPLNDLVFDAETSTTMCNFDSGEFGIIHLTMTLGDAGLEGTVSVPTVGMDFPIVGTLRVDTQ